MLTIDNFLHFFYFKTDIDPSFSLKLENSHLSFNIIDEEYYLTISKDQEKYLIRINNYENYKKWKQELSLYF